MSDLAPFDPNSKCRKCGNTEAATLYVAPVAASDEHPAVEREHLARRCLRCGHRWIEACLTDDDHEAEAKRLRKNASPTGWCEEHDDEAGKCVERHAEVSRG